VSGPRPPGPDDPVDPDDRQDRRADTVSRVRTDVHEAPAGPVTDDELAALALAADPDAPLDADAEPLDGAWGRNGDLPLWYMPAPAGTARGGGPAIVAGIVILALLVVVASGFCITYGILEIA
jgi:hypothetical protein